MQARSPAEGWEWDWAAVTGCCLRAARRVLGTRPEAEDAAQEAALIAWKMRRQCRTPDHPWPWIATIAHREALRASAPPSEPIEDSPEPVIPCEESATLLRLDIESALAGLAEVDRLLLHARYWQDLTQDQIARALELPDGTVRIRLHRLRERLRPILLSS